MDGFSDGLLMYGPDGEIIETENEAEEYAAGELCGGDTCALAETFDTAGVCGGVPASAADWCDAFSCLGFGDWYAAV